MRRVATVLGLVLSLVVPAGVQGQTVVIVPDQEPPPRTASLDLPPYPPPRPGTLSTDGPCYVRRGIYSPGCQRYLPPSDPGLCRTWSVYAYGAVHTVYSENCPR